MTTTDFAGRGWAYPATVRPNGSIATVGGAANIERAIRVILRTRLGERPMRPDFGSRLHEFMFDGITPDRLAAVEAEVARALASCEPRVRVDSVRATAAAARGHVDIDIAYTVLATNDAHNLVVPFYSIPGEDL
jgi:phage baseplate assembly protein W